MPGLSPEQRRLLFDAAVEELALPLPGGEAPADRVAQRRPAAMPRSTIASATATLLIAAFLVAIFAAMVIWFRTDLQNEIHQKIIERDAAVLYPMALQQMEDSEASGRQGAIRTRR